MHQSSLPLFISWVFRIILVVFNILQVWLDPRGLLWMLPLTATGFLPVLFPRFHQIHHLTFTTVFGIGTLGVFFQAFAKFPLLDDVLHVLTPAVLALFFYHVAKERFKTKHPRFLTFAAVIGIALSWELFEWLIANYLAPAIPFRVTPKDTLLDISLALATTTLLLISKPLRTNT